jgi:hypothetical protein
MTKAFFRGFELFSAGDGHAEWLGVGSGLLWFGIV